MPDLFSYIASMALGTQVFRIHIILSGPTNAYTSCPLTAVGDQVRKKEHQGIWNEFLQVLEMTTWLPTWSSLGDTLTLKFSDTRVMNSLTALVSKQKAVESLKLCKLLLCLPRETFLLVILTIVQLLWCDTILFCFR